VLCGLCGSYSFFVFPLCVSALNSFSEAIVDLELLPVNVKYHPLSVYSVGSVVVILFLFFLSASLR
jgi:hypothetical protein